MRQDDVEERELIENDIAQKKVVGGDWRRRLDCD